MKETGILFRPEMVRAILDDRKDKSRRTRGLDRINEHPDEWKFEGRVVASACNKDIGTYSFLNNESDECVKVKCPYGEGGDRLWVKEAWWHHKSDYLEQAAFEGRTITKLRDGVGCEPNINAEFHPSDYPWVWKKKSPRYMPRWASRLTLEITDIRVERVQDITEGDAMAEGIFYHNSIGGIGPDGYRHSQSSPVYGAASQAFFALISTIHGPDFVALNPWVWVITFKKIS